MAGIECSKAEIANILGVSAAAIGQWVTKGCPWVVKGGKGVNWVFNSADVTGWRAEQLAQQSIGSTAGLTLDEAKLRKLVAEAVMVELDLSKRKGEVIEMDAVAQVVGDDYANVRAKLLSLPSKLAPQIIGIEDPAEIQALLERGVAEALEELTADGIYSGTEGEAVESKAVQSQAAA